MVSVRSTLFGNTYIIRYIQFKLGTYLNLHTYKNLTATMFLPHIVSAEINQGRKLLNFRRFILRKLFKGGKYSRAETIRGNTVLTLLVALGIPCAA